MFTMWGFNYWIDNLVTELDLAEAWGGFTLDAVEVFGEMEERYTQLEYQRVVELRAYYLDQLKALYLGYMASHGTSAANISIIENLYDYYYAIMYSVTRSMDFAPAYEAAVEAYQTKFPV